MDLKTYLEPPRERGTAARLAEQIGVPPVSISQWASNARFVPEDRAPALERATAFNVRVETSCPGSRWVRIPHPDWPHGLPLLDKSPMPSQSTEVAV